MNFDFNPEELAAEFSDTFDASHDPDLLIKLVEEELTEVEQALAETLKEVADLFYITCGLLNTVGRDELEGKLEPLISRLDRANLLLSDELLDLVPAAFVRVHESNMSKLGDDGKPILREDGKILKGPNYKAPDLLDLITGGER